VVKFFKSHTGKKRLVVQALKGQTDNEWANTESMYGWFAYFFHWTPEQVDKIPYDRLTYISTTLKEIKRKENSKQ
jgi:hypothetical protein